jgi:small-conductance mechanosensitive channel
MLDTLIEILKLNSGVFTTVYMNNTVGAYVASLVFFLGIVVALKLVEVVVIAHLRSYAKRTKTYLDDVIVQIVGTINPPLYLFIAFYLSVRALVVSTFIEKALYVVLIAWLTYQSIKIIEVAINYILKKNIELSDGENKSSIKFLSNIFKFVLWVIGALVILQNIGIDVTALVAGLGIGGIAIALAVQNILGDLFSSFSIVFDKPFIVGDVIKVNGLTGTIESIGIKTSRMRSPEGEEIVLSNTELTTAQIQNFGRLAERRVELKIGVVYGTTQAVFKKIPDLMRGIIDSVEGIRFQRTHFVSFGDSALVFQTHYHVESSDYDVFLDKQQQVNMRIKELFEKEKIIMAYPTQTIHVQK